jgi:hypothetical protein
MPKHFLLGIGAQKSGSTWLRNYIQSSPNADLGFTKEYHIFDALWVKEQQICKEFLQNRISKVIAPGAMPSEEDKLLLQFLGSIDAYFSYFKSISDHQEIVVTGDITPSYAALPKQGYQQIRVMAEKYGFETKVVFIMRDPVERCISANRMSVARKMKAGHKAIDENEALESMYQTLGCQLRTRYDLTIKNVESVFDQRNIYYGFYEDLFNEESLAKLCAFLNIPYVSPNLEQRLNSSSSHGVIQEELIKKIRGYYGLVYDFVGDKFGKDTVVKCWKNF